VCVWTLGEGTKQHIGEADECEHAPIDGGSDGHLSISKSKTVPEAIPQTESTEVAGVAELETVR